ncbi:hypothetical protein [Lacipirellula sp.]|uniref:hypothetical protein n=1 Tax=Lacipirellula sp. TaxID=2691419 RepID=UPI003D0E6F89
MKRLPIVSLACSVALFASSAGAATFNGVSHDITDFVNGSEVSTRGTLVDAVNLLNANVDGIGVSTMINGVLFKGTQPGAYHEGAESFGEASFVYHGGDGYADSNLWTSGGAYDTLADSQIYNVDNGNVNFGDGYGVVNLVPGQLYELQVFMLDDRSGVSKTFPLQFQQAAFTGVFDELNQNTPAVEIGYMEGITIGGNGVTQANGEIATITFSIDPGYNGLLVNTWSSGAFNGMQLRMVDAITGDLDHSGFVDGADFLLWQRGYGTQYTQADLDAIKANFGTPQAAVAVASVPEPAAAALGATAGLIGWLARRRRS